MFSDDIKEGVIASRQTVRFIARHAASFDRRAARAFLATAVSVSAVLLAGLALLIAARLLPDVLALRPLAVSLFHASFRIASIGVVAGFAADIAAKLPGSR